MILKSTYEPHKSAVKAAIIQQCNPTHRQQSATEFWRDVRTQVKKMLWYEGVSLIHRTEWSVSLTCPWNQGHIRYDAKLLVLTYLADEVSAGKPPADQPKPKCKSKGNSKRSEEDKDEIEPPDLEQLRHFIMVKPGVYTQKFTNVVQKILHRSPKLHDLDYVSTSVHLIDSFPSTLKLTNYYYNCCSC